MARVLLFAIFLSALLTGCAWFLGIEQTDTSSVQPGASRSVIEDALGEPIKRQPYTFGEVAIYKFNLGYHGLSEDEDTLATLAVPPYIFATPLFAGIGAVQEPFIREGQTGYVTVVYGLDNNVIALNEQVVTKLERAVRGNLEAQYELGSRDDIDKAVRWKWLCVAAHGGHALAQESVGDHYRLALQPVEWDPAQAFTWYGRSQTPEARNHLNQLAKSMTAEQQEDAERFAQSWQPDPASCDEGARWLASQKQWNSDCLGAHQYDPKAMLRLGHSYEKGAEGYQRDLNRAYFWYRLAEINGVVEKGTYYVKTSKGWRCCGDRSKSEHLAEGMTPKEIAKVESLLANWQSDPTGCEVDVAQISESL